MMWIILLVFIFLIFVRIFKVLSVRRRYQGHILPNPISQAKTLARLGYKGSEVAFKVGELCWTEPFRSSGELITFIGNYLFTIPMVFPNRTEAIKILLSSKHHVQKNYVHYDNVLGLGLLNVDKKIWAGDRKLLNPCFRTSYIADAVPMMNDKIGKLVDQLMELSQKNHQIDNFTELLSPKLMEILLESVIGTNLGVDKKFIDTIDNLDEMNNNRLSKVIYMLDWTFKWTKSGKWYFDHVKHVRQVASNIIVEKLSNKLDCDSTSVTDTLIKEHLADPTKMTIDHITDQVVTFLVAGWDTTKWMTSFILHAIGSYPEIQEKIFQEIKQIIDDPDNLTMSHISQMRYLECVMYEAMRLNPVATYFARMLDSDLSFVQDGVMKSYPAGSFVFVVSDLFHKSPRYWKNPNRFIPERFLPENKSQIDPFAFFPFSLGPRNCIGKLYAMVEMKVIVSLILIKMRIEAVDLIEDVHPNLSGSVRRAKKPIRLRFFPRQ